MSLHQRLWLLVGLPLFIAVAIAWALVNAGNKLNEGSTALRATQQELALYDEFGVSTLAAEVWAKVYVASGDLVDRDCFEQASRLVSERGAQILETIHLHPVRTIQGKAIVTIAGQIIALIEQPVFLMQSGQREKARALVAAVPERALLSRFRSLRSHVVVTLRGEQTREAADLLRLRLHWLAVVEAAIVIAGAISALIVGTTLATLREARARMRRLGDQVRLLAAGKSLRPADPSLDDIADLDRIIHGIADELQSKNAVLTRYALLAESTTEIFIFFDRSTHRIIGANAAALLAYGYTQEEFLQLYAEDIRVADLSFTAEDTFSLVDRGMLDVTHESVHVRKDGSTFPIEATLRIGYADNQPIVLASLRDITRRKQALIDVSAALDEANNSAEMRTAFVASVSHEIRTPMNGIIGMTELVLRTPLDALQREYIETVYDSAHSLLKIVNDILDFSKIDAGKLELDHEEFDIGRVVESVIDLLAGASKRQNVALMSYIAPGVPRLVKGDAGRLRQILMNLVGNALKFTESGHVKVSIEAAHLDQGKGRFDFRVEDTGIGIPPESLVKLFRPFEQGDASTTKRFGGSGLGLVITRSIVEFMGGALALKSEGGDGTTAEFHLPFEIANSSPTASSIHDLSNARLLIVESDPATRLLLEQYGVGWGMRVQSTSSPEAAGVLREAVRSSDPFDVAIVDCGFDEKHAQEIAAEIGADPGIASTKLMMVTSRTIDLLDSPVRGFVAFIRRPIAQSTVYDRLVEVMSGSPKPKREIARAANDDHFLLPGSRHVQVLVAEDNAINRRVAERQLSILGCSVTLVTDGSEAFNISEDSSFGVIFMDCQMPVMDGLTATRAIRAREMERGWPRVPIVGVTANASTSDRDKCLAAGMDHYVTKPVVIESLSAALVSCGY